MILNLNKDIMCSLFFILFIILSFFNISFEIFPSCKYPLTKRLINGNNLLICSTEIYFYDSEFVNIISQINTSNWNSSCVISVAYLQFLEEDNGYITVLKNGFNYIFSQEVTLLSNIKISFYIPGKHY